MLLKSTTYQDVIKFVRKKIIKFSGLNDDRVLNSLSVRGPDLFKTISTTEVTSFDSMGDSFIVFELNEDETGEYALGRKNDSKMESVNSWNFNIKIYGNSCHELAKRISAGFKMSEEMIDLRNNYGIHTSGVSAITSINEFINETVWMRCDLTIKLQTRTEIEMKESGDTILTADFILKTY